MKKLLFIFLVCFSLNALGQDTNAVWVLDTDLSNFTIKYKVKNIPKEFYSFIDIESKDDIVDKDGEFKRYCVGPGITRRLNWIANDKSKKWVFSISYGGRAYYTIYYCVDYINGKINVIGYVKRGESNVLTLEELKVAIREKNIDHEEIDFFDE